METKITLSEFLDNDKPKGMIKKMSFEQAMSLLEELCDAIESGKLGLDGVVDSYERGISLMDHLQAQLVKAENQIRELGGGDSRAAEA